MESGGGLIKYKEYRIGCLAFGQEGGELDTLPLATRKCAAGLAQLNVPQAHIQEGLNFLCNFNLADFTEELDGLVYRHAKDVRNIFFMDLNLQHVILKAFPVALLALQVDVRHELHFHRHKAIALANLAASSICVEREVLGLKAAKLGVFLVGIEGAYVVVGLEVGDRVRT